MANKQIRQMGTLLLYSIKKCFGKSIQTYVALNELDTEEIAVSYDYILCKHLIANTEFDYLALPAEYNRLFIPPRNQPASSIIPVANRPSPSTTHSCSHTGLCQILSERERLYRRRSREESAENFGQMAVSHNLPLMIVADMHNPQKPRPHCRS